MIYQLPRGLPSLCVDTDLFGRDGLSPRQVLDVLSQLRDGLGRCAWNVLAINAAVRAVTVGTPRQVFGVLRLAVTGKMVSPPMCESLEILGREVVWFRLCGAIEAVSGEMRKVAKT